ncbi:MAG: tyrosine-type recombinase/integrase [Oscillospiraceae bacterium]|nr:tyrosine-type recombinase/integrase [Oscillospiraceae bacterium]
MDRNSNIKDETQKYLQFCTQRKNLDSKTIKSYSIDLRQFTEFISENNLFWISKSSIENYIDSLHNTLKPKSVKRKIASLKAFFHYLEIEEIIEINPFHKIQIKYKEPFILPKTIPLKTIEKIMNYAYLERKRQTSSYGRKVALRNTLILELLFATGMRISELCSLTNAQIDFNDYIIKIYGKGSKERLIQICNKNVQNLLDEYRREFDFELKNYNYFFINRLCNRLSEQSVRNMINSYSKSAGVSIHITPHMFRHSFATLLLEEDVDIRYIQQMLGHSSITTTQIYTHTSINKQKNILSTKHPRNKFEIVI